ncbi:MAG: outer membrane protein [Bdellovibrionia bacterium]
MIRTLVTVCLATSTLISFNTWGAEEQPEAKPEGKSWRGVFIGGANFSGGTDYTLKNTVTGASASITGDSAKAQALFGAEITYQKPEFPLGGSLIFEGTKYKYNDGTATADGQKSLLLMPRIAAKAGPAEIWAGVGVGLMFLNIDGPTSATQNNVSLTLLDTSSTGFAWSPRIGVDFDVNDQLFIGGQFSYTQSSGSLDMRATSNGTTVPLSDDYTRHWISLALRVGAKF